MGKAGRPSLDEIKENICIEWFCESGCRNLIDTGRKISGSIIIANAKRSAEGSKCECGSKLSHFGNRCRPSSEVRKCKVCKKELHGIKRRQVCSDECKKASIENYRKIANERRSSKRIDCPDCGKSRPLKGVEKGQPCTCKYGLPSPFVQCSFCGDEVKKNRQQVERNKGCYCSTECFNWSRVAARRISVQLENQIKNAVETPFPKACIKCNYLFIGSRDYCGCRPRKNCVVCGAEHTRGRDICSTECSVIKNKQAAKSDEAKAKRKAYIQSIKGTEKWKALQRRSRHRRRAMMKNVEYEKFDSIDVFNRDGWACSYCSCEVIQYPNNPGVEQNEATIDHVIPIAKGGPHTLANVVTACRLCNSSKAAKDVEAFIESIA